MPTLTLDRGSAIRRTPSFRTQKYMWLGDLLGTAAGFAVYPAYLFTDADVKHGLIANALGGLAGVAIAGALTYDLKDDPSTSGSSFHPPFSLGVGTTERGGPMMNASGTF